MTDKDDPRIHSNIKKANISKNLAIIKENTTKKYEDHAPLKGSSYGMKLQSFKITFSSAEVSANENINK